ncbi:MAG: hypothetical protein AABX83_03335 [Nanoarchaeota archaeon]
MKIEQALEELRKHEKRKFNQSVDVIINLKGLDLKRENINAVITLPHKIKDKKICGFFDKKSESVDSITKPEFPKYKDKKALRKLIKEYDFFIASAHLMPTVAATFGKVLGPSGKMPSPQLGILNNENDETIKQVSDRITKSIKIRVKEASIKTTIGNETMKNEQIIENFNAFYNGIVNVLPTKRDNIKNIMLKFTMTKPLKLEAN